MFHIKQKSLRQFLIICALFGVLLGEALSVAAQTTAFTYQGRLTDNAMPANGTYDMQFALYDTANGGGGTQQGATVTRLGVSVTNGVFTVSLDFTAAPFVAGADRYLEITVRGPSGSAATLAPRQMLTPAPTAIQSLNAATASNANQLGGVAPNGYLQTSGSGANLTNLNASNITTGTLDSMRIPNLDASRITTGTFAAAQIPNLDTAKITTGTFADTRLSANVAFRNQANTFTGNQTISGNLAQTGTTADLNLANGFLTRGTFGTGAIPATGAGTRMMFYPNKAAFRAGVITGTQWDDVNIGNYSTALGINAVASGDTSFAMGNFTTATGVYSTAMGDSTMASGDRSTAMGNGTLASGTNSTAMGGGTMARGTNSTAMGSSTTARGTNSTAMGSSTTASGDFSVAMGNYASTNNMQGSFVYGDRTDSTIINANAPNQFVVRAQNIWLGKTNAVTSTANRFIETSTGAYLSTSGVWTDNSSVNLKTNFAALDSRDVLRKVLNLRIQSWNYKADTPNIRHIGVMAQDFYQAFQIGADNEHITAVDTAGVTMAAIQGLDEKLDERAAQLETENNSLKEQLKSQQTQITTQQKTIEQQQRQIDALVKMTCAANPSADVCRPEEK